MLKYLKLQVEGTVLLLPFLSFRKKQAANPNNY